ncbi:hypothetical protein IFM89_034637 [Coptis chinensis]|uniref:Pentatricopeptide repeat-containing protein n=1 Tax=Coptis chinensis TaxID=261450 RepID=A0A835HS77_9MAGN|nr:hypothetical protein IFM89_034637 [Coptis chinensis]
MVAAVESAIGISRKSLGNTFKVTLDGRIEVIQEESQQFPNPNKVVYGRCGKATEAERLFKELGSKVFLPDAVTYNSLLYAFAREGNVGRVKEMVQAGFGRDEMPYNSMIHMYGKQGQHDLAFHLYKDMKSGGCNNYLHSLINGYAKNLGSEVEVEETFNCMVRSGIKPDHLAYSVMLDILLRSNETKKFMVRSGIKPDHLAYSVMLDSLLRSNETKKVHVLRACATTAMFAGYAKHVEPLLSLEVYSNMVCEGVELNGVVIVNLLLPDGTLYEVIVYALCNAGKGDIVMKFYKEMVCKNIEVDMNLYNVLMNCLSRSGNILDVRLVGEDMINVSQVPQQKFKGILLKLPHYNKACKLYDELLESGIQPDIVAMTALVAGKITYYMVKFHPGFSHFVYAVLIMFSCVAVAESCMMVIATLVLNYMMGIVTGAGCKVHMNLLMNWDP